MTIRRDVQNQRKFFIVFLFIQFPIQLETFKLLRSHSSYDCCELAFAVPSVDLEAIEPFEIGGDELQERPGTHKKLDFVRFRTILPKKSRSEINADSQFEFQFSSLPERSK